MSVRGNKRRVSRLLYGRFHAPVPWRSAEEQSWLDLAPVGREFGSPDYERLSILDMYSWGSISELEAMRQLGLDARGLAAMLEADGLTPPEGDVRALKGMFGQASRTVTIEEMNPLRRKP
jgi:hypothetical protein